MSYVSLYRKYRSQTFSDLIGQGHVVRTLQNGISSGRIAHAYLFTGPRGTGKTSTARLLAKALCCENGPSPEPDNSCDICQEITAGSFVDVVELDAASESGVEDIREKIVEVAEYRPMVSRYKVFIIDEVHDLSGKAFDALLKTIEEPPSHLIFILATTEYNKVPPTIRSRCQKFEFHRASMQDLVNRLTYVANAEGIQIDPPAVTAIARMADGGYRDALTLLEQAILTSEEGRITLAQVYDQLGLVSEEVVDDLLLSIRATDVPRIMELLAEIARLGRDPRAILESMLYRLQDLTRASYHVDSSENDAAREASLHETAARLGREFTLRLRGGLAEAHKVIRDVSLPRLWLESELIRLSQVTSAAPAAVAPAPAAEPARPAAVKPKPAPVPAPEPTPAPSRFEQIAQELAAEMPIEPPVAPVAAPEPPKTAVEPWDALLNDVRMVSKTLRNKLEKVRPAGIEDGILKLEFEMRTAMETFATNPKAMAVLRDTALKHFAGITDIRCVAIGRKDLLLAEPETVELPAEGERLEQLARLVFEQNEP